MGNCHNKQGSVWVRRHPTESTPRIAYRFQFTTQDTLDDLFTRVEARFNIQLSGVYKCDPHGQCDFNQALMLDQLVSAVTSTNDANHPIWYTAVDDNMEAFLQALHDHFTTPPNDSIACCQCGDSGCFGIGSESVATGSGVAAAVNVGAPTADDIGGVGSFVGGGSL